MRDKIVRGLRPIYYKIPFLRPPMAFIHRKFFIKTKFSGWGMKTVHELPWNDDYDWDIFRKTSTDAKNLEFSKDGAQIDRNNLDELLWTHWILCYAIRHAAKFAKTDYYNFVECGVADGCSAFFALREINGQENLKDKFSMHLYDSWTAMREEGLLKSEFGHIGKYAQLNIEKTKRNLKEFTDHIVYHQGFVPESFNAQPESPKSIVFLHIDLNSAKPTLYTLDFFLPRLTKGGVILFDDYAWEGYEDTKKTVDAYFQDKPGILMKLPTGQAIYYN